MAGRKAKLNGLTKMIIFKCLCHGDSMVTVSRKIGVARASIYRWINEDKKLKARVTEAREIKATRKARFKEARELRAAKNSLKDTTLWLMK